MTKQLIDIPGPSSLLSSVHFTLSYVDMCKLPFTLAKFYIYIIYGDGGFPGYEDRGLRIAGSEDHLVKQERAGCNGEPRDAETRTSASTDLCHVRI